MNVTGDLENSKDLGDLAKKLKSTTLIGFAEQLVKKPFSSLSEDVRLNI